MGWISAFAGMTDDGGWIPAFAGMTGDGWDSRFCGNDVAGFRGNGCLFAQLFLKGCRHTQALPEEFGTFLMLTQLCQQLAEFVIGICVLA